MALEEKGMTRRHAKTGKGKHYTYLTFCVGSVVQLQYKCKKFQKIFFLNNLQMEYV